MGIVGNVGAGFRWEENKRRNIDKISAGLLSLIFFLLSMTALLNQWRSPLRDYQWY